MQATDFRESKLDASGLEQYTNVDNYKIRRCYRYRHRGCTASYERNDNILPLYPCEIENTFLKTLLANSKRKKWTGIVGTICRTQIKVGF